MTLSSPDRITLVKGAPEIILPGCREAMGPNGEAVSYDRAGIYARFRDAAGRGERVIAVSAKRAGGASLFVALLILKDRLRSDARAAVRRIREAGIRVVMVTGDAPETASAIAADAGILRGGADVVLNAADLSRMSDGEVAALLPRLCVVARALPQDKTRLVRIAQGEGLVVGMTGDGINDAPSLRLSDVGFAMGSGCDVAKGAADIVITDNSLSSIGNTVLFGRTVFHSIRKFITFQLMMNLAACGTSLLGQFIGIDNPITIIQMLWINIIMDTLGGLAFAGEAALSSYMKESPKRRDEPILTREVLHRVIFTGGYTLALSVAFLIAGRNAPLFGGEIPRYLTAFYELFVFSGLFNCFNARTERVRLLAGVGKNKPFLLILTAVALIQTAMIFFGGETFRCVPLSAKEFFVTLALAATVIPFDFIRRVLRKLRK